MSCLHDFPDLILMRAGKLSDATTLFLFLRSIHCKPNISDVTFDAEALKLVSKKETFHTS